MGPGTAQSIATVVPRIQALAAETDISGFTCRFDNRIASQFYGLNFSVSSEKFDLSLTTPALEDQRTPATINFVDRTSGRTVRESAFSGNRDFYVLAELANSLHTIALEKLDQRAAKKLPELAQVVQDIPAGAWRSVNTGEHFGPEPQLNLQAEHDGAVVRLSKITNNRYGRSRDCFSATVLMPADGHVVTEGLSHMGMTARGALIGQANINSADPDSPIGKMFKGVVDNHPELRAKAELEAAASEIIQTIPAESWSYTGAPGLHIDVSYNQYIKTVETDRYRVTMSFVDYGSGHHWNSGTVALHDKSTGTTVGIGGNKGISLFNSVDCGKPEWSR